jgi:hypothetical protein
MPDSASWLLSHHRASPASRHARPRSAWVAMLRGAAAWWIKSDTWYPFRGRLWADTRPLPRRARTTRKRRNRPFAGPLPSCRSRPSRDIRAAPADGRTGQKAVVRARPPAMLTTGSRQFVEQLLCVFQVGGVEALGEPAVDRREQVAGFGAPALFAPEASEIAGSAQFQ